MTQICDLSVARAFVLAHPETPRHEALMPIIGSYNAVSVLFKRDES